MEPNQLQLVLNVVTITGLTSLAGYCYLLKKENRRLATARPAESSTQQQSREGVPTVVSLGKSPAPATNTVVEQDIRLFAAGRRTNWVKGMASATS